MSWTVIYDGNTLDNSIGCAIDKIKDSPMVKLKESPLLSDGSAIEQYTKGGRRISMSGTIIGTSTSNLDSRVSNVIESFSNPSGGLLKLSDREIYAYPKLGSLELIKGSSNLAMQFGVDFFTESPYWRATATTTETISLSSSSTNATTSAITYNGTAPVRPIIKIQQHTSASGARDPLTLSVGNVTLDSPEYIRISNAALGNTTDKIVLDSTDESVYLENDTSSSTKPPKRIDGAFFRLQNGSNTIFLDAHTTGGHITVSLVYKANYYSSNF
ncbi:MAG: putative tail protein [Prokaryotic dsDNA virus sp.]|nr:MAG: putative tail protein [Prokaryotic dsDNA virus sp.]|tara:strand:- start:9213 stop:10028 length:816 start_codon:yes stop_codon:yes gene_type:complete